MKALVPILLAIAMAFASAAHAFECERRPVLSTTKHDGTKFGIFISGDQIKEGPEWSPENGEPPLSLSQAATIAKQWAEAEYTRFDGVEIGSISLRPYGCFRNKNYWYYIFDFSPVIDGNTVYGSEYMAAVLMDGTIIGPEAVGDRI